MILASGDLWAGAETQIYNLVTAETYLGKVDPICVILNPGVLETTLRKAGVAVELFPEADFPFSQLVRKIVRILKDNKIEADAIGGMTLGADPIVCPVSALSHLEGPAMRAFIVRKEAKDHGTGRQIEGDLEPKSRVVVVDDVVTTGGSTLRAIEAVEAAGHRIVAVLCLVDREEGGTEKLRRWPYFPLFRRSEIFDKVAAD